VRFTKVIPPLELLAHRYERFIAKEYSKTLAGTQTGGTAEAANSKPSSI
jgi:hypothetical protein